MLSSSLDVQDDISAKAARIWLHHTVYNLVLPLAKELSSGPATITFTVFSSPSSPRGFHEIILRRNI